ncbi:trigger factor [bacterium]|nr:MAG: trigger factor [bacterium]
MQIKKNNRQDGAIKLIVSLDKVECHNYYQKTLDKIKQNFSQKGFRKGTVPQKLIEKNASSQLLLEYEENALRAIVSKSFQQEKIIPVLRPEIKIIKSAPGEIFECEIEVVPYPKVKAGQYKNLKLKREEVQVSKQEIDKALEFLKQSRASFKTVSRPAKQNDQLEISFDAFLNDKKVTAGSSSYYPLRLGKSRLHPEFEKQLYGMRPAEEKNFRIKFSQDWPQEVFQEKTINFKIKIKSVAETILPDLDDKFAKSLGHFDNMVSLKKSLEEGLLKERQNEKNKKFQENLLQKIITNSEIKIPDILIKKEAERLMKNFSEGLEIQKIDFNEYLKRTKTTIKDLEKSLRKQAEKRLQGAFLLNEIAKAENLFPQEQEIEENINEQLKEIKNHQKNPEDIDLEKLRSYTFEYLTNQKVVNWLIKNNICV